MSNVRIDWDEAALGLVLHGKEGPVARELERRAIKAQGIATQHCPVRTGRLRASIEYTLDRDTAGLVAWIGTNVAYALHVEVGTSRMAARPYLRPALEAVR